MAPHSPFDGEPPDALDAALGAAQTGVFRLTPSTGDLTFPVPPRAGAVDACRSLETLLSVID